MVKLVAREFFEGEKVTWEIKDYTGILGQSPCFESKWESEKNCRKSDLHCFNKVWYLKCNITEKMNKSLI